LNTLIGIIQSKSCHFEQMAAKIIVDVLDDMKRDLGGEEMKVRQNLLRQMIPKIEIGHDYGQ
jgi:hypothetical protein